MANFLHKFNPFKSSNDKFIELEEKIFITVKDDVYMYHGENLFYMKPIPADQGFNPKEL